MALTKKQMGVDAYKWCLFLKKEFKITDSVASAIYYKYVKGVLADRELLEIGYKPTRELDNVWIPKFRADLQNFVKDVKGIGLQNYLRIVNGFNFDYFTITTFNVLIEDFIANGTEGSTILPFSKFFEYVVKITDDYKQQYSRTVVDKITRENVLDRIRVSDVLLLDVHCKVIDVNQERYADKVEFITSREAYWVEKTLFKYLKMLEQEKYDYVTQENIDYVLKKNKAKLNKKQNQFIQDFSTYGFNCLIGLGGSGKSYTSKVAIDIIVRSGYNVVLMTPTGISAKVLTNYTGRQAFTVHRYFLSMKGVGKSEAIDKEEDLYTENIDEMVYYCDELGMWGLTHFKMLCDNILEPAMAYRERFIIENPDVPKEEIPKLPKLVFVGDTNQLQPISSGCFFRDILDLIKIGQIKANLTELIEIMRAKSDTYIPYICNKYCVDYSPMEDTMYMNEEPNVFMLPLSEELETGDALGKFIYEYMQEMNSVDPNNPYNFENTTIMLPQKVGDKGTKKINEVLDTLYKKDNPNAKTIGMIMKNNYDLMVFNGDRFRLEGKEVYEENHYRDKQGNPKVEIVYEYTITMLDDDREVKFKDGDVNWELAYCSTVHKLQGCTSENVIFVASRTHTFMLTKQLVYTALSRASKTLTVLYDKFTFENARKRDTKYNRKTFLGEIVKLRKGKGGR
uniref:ATP dependent DNA helicase n=1 Tax=Ackermannviridae sp. ctaCq7 TaxID=2827294 RepID=A0A8S5R624_9CAUD|nr:MAG TPA: ATP dependent DNA helicase [Ackermannviridae sp. ctaCq7]